MLDGGGFFGTELCQLWAECRDEILSWWIKTNPGTRPTHWWRFDAPRWDDPWPDRFYHGTFAIPRERIRGTGTPLFECLADVPTFDKGVPDGWLTSEELEYYGSLTVESTGEPAEAFDPARPPTYEAEAVYLKRHGLLAKGEQRRIPAQGWEPVPATEVHHDESPVGP